MQREILRRNWKRFLIQLQKSSDAVSDSPAGMFFSLKRVARSDSRVSGFATTERLTRTSKGRTLEFAGPSDAN